MKGADIKEYIRKEGYTQAEIAKRCNISQQALQQRLSAQSISLTTIEMIASAMRCSPDKLLKQNYEDDTYMLRQEITRLRLLLKEKDAEIERLKKQMGEA